MFGGTTTLVFAAMVPGVVLAQQPTLEDLQRQLDEATKATKAQQAKKQAKPDTSQTSRPPTTVASPKGIRFAASGSELLPDAQWRVVWTKTDNGLDITWEEARSWCAKRVRAGGFPQCLSCSPSSTSLWSGAPAAGLNVAFPSHLP